MRPVARKDQLLVEELPEETLVYDLENHKAHCLNPMAAFVWQHCNGKTGIPELAKLLQEKFAMAADEDVIRLALDRLAKAHLLRRRLDREARSSRYSRRQLVKKLGRIGVALPVVLSVVSPAAAQGSCITRPDCFALLPPFCNGQAICNEPGKCCVAKGTECDRQNC